MHQASSTADVYLARAIQAIEERLGEGAASKFPQIVAAHMQSAASDFHASMTRVSTQEIEDNVGKLAYEFERFVDYLNSTPWFRVSLEKDDQGSRA